MRNNSYMSSRKSTVPTRVMLIIIWILIIAVLGLMGYLFYNQAATLDGSIESPSDSGGINATALVVVYDDSYDKTPPSFTLLNFSGESHAISVAVIPSDAVCNTSAGKSTLEQQFAYGGVVQAVDAVNTLCGINIDYYAAIECQSLQTVTDIMGAFKYTIPQDMNTKSSDGVIMCDIQKGVQSISAQQLTEFFRFNGWSANERAKELSKLTAAMINAYSTEQTSAKITSLFGEVAADIETNLSIIQIGNLQSEYANFMVLKSTASEIDVSTNGGVIDDKIIKTISKTF